MKITKTITVFIAAVFSLALVAASPLTSAVDSGTATRYLAFTSDIHGLNDRLTNALTGLPGSTEYVSLIGDMVGSHGGDAPAFNSSTLLGLVQDKLSNISSQNMSIIWADHDSGVNDDASIVELDGGHTSGEIFQKNDDSGNPLYYIYGVGYYDMTTGGTTSQTAAENFKTWVDTIDPSIPVIVLCHVPLHAARGDNFGATYWTEALNYAATGTNELIGSTETKKVIRDVFYFYGHNHTVDATEYFATVGDTMNIQIDGSTLLGQYSESTLTSAGHALVQSTGDDEEIGSVSATGLSSKVFFTSLVTGYIKTSGNATLMSIGEDTISLTKYNGGEKVSLGTNISSQAILGNTYTINRVSSSETPKAPDAGIARR